jgi:hypothetical protein
MLTLCNSYILWLLSFNDPTLRDFYVTLCYILYPYHLQSSFNLVHVFLTPLFKIKNRYSNVVYFHRTNKYSRVPSPLPNLRQSSTVCGPLGFRTINFRGFLQRINELIFSYTYKNYIFSRISATYNLYIKVSCIKY